MQYGSNKNLIKRRVLLALLVVASAVLQNACGMLSVGVWARPLLLVPLCVCLAMFETNTAAALFGAFSGLLLDVSCVADGFNTLVLMLLSAVTSVLISHFMRNNLLTALVLGTGATAVYEFLYGVVCHFANGVRLFSGFFTYYIPLFVITAVFIPVYYFVVKAVFDRWEVAR